MTGTDEGRYVSTLRKRWGARGWVLVVLVAIDGVTSAAGMLIHYAVTR